MAAPFEELSSLDKLIHEPARLAILTALSACKGADFLFLKRLTGLTKGNLSGHTSKLEEAGLVTVTKEFDGKTPRTLLSLTPEGEQAISAYWANMQRLHADISAWRDEG
jgi:DNA-binding transcriptional ArsR family regulator